MFLLVAQALVINRRNITGVVFRGPGAIAWDSYRCKPDPFAPRRAAIVEIQTRMIHQDRQTAANQHHHKKEIEEVAVTNPNRKPVRPYEVVGIYLRKRLEHEAARPRRLRSKTPRLQRGSRYRFRSGWTVESRYEIGDQADSGPLCVPDRTRSILPPRTAWSNFKKRTAWLSMWAAGTIPKKIKRAQPMVQKPRKTTDSIRRRKQP